MDVKQIAIPDPWESPQTREGAVVVLERLAEMLAGARSAVADLEARVTQVGGPTLRGSELP
jgi:hypothetical protein